MGETQNDTKTGSSNLWLWVILLPVLYVLSIGPVAKFLTVIHASSDTHNLAKTFYAPVIWLHGNTILKKPIESYMELWGM